MHRHMSFVDCSCKARQHGRPMYQITVLRFWVQISLVIAEGTRDWVKSYIIPLLRLPKPNIFRSQAHDISIGVDYTSPSTSRSDINTNVMFHDRIEVMMRVC